MSESNKKETWEDQLVKKYPKLLEHCYPSVNEGWKDILDNMLGCIQHYLTYTDLEVQPYFSQIKEKFGTGRFYYYGGDDYVRGVVSMAEGMTFHTCEECGNRGEEKPTSWIKTLCDDCFENYEQIRQERWGISGKMSESNKEGWQKLEVTEIVENPDGTATIVFELEDEFREWFKKSFGLKRWSDKRFQKVMLEALQHQLQTKEPENKDS